jgi:two-component system cell cycle sensor histidine kinase/response regulator CckA
MERSRFVRFLALLAPAAVVFSLFELVVGAVFRSAAATWSGTFLLIYGLALIPAWRLAGRGRVRHAALLTATMLLVMDVLLAIVQPGQATNLILVPILALAIALPYVDRRELIGLIVLAWLASIAVVVMGEVALTDGQGLAWFDRIIRVGGVSAGSALIFALGWQFKVRSMQRLGAMREREQKARAARTRYRALFEDSPVGLFRVAADGTVVDANPALVRALGLPNRSALVGDSAAWLAPSLLDEAVLGAVHGRDVETVGGAGSPVWLRLSVRALTPGPSATFEGSAEDITEQRQTQERLLQAVKLESVGLLAGGVAHDFNNLLTSIRGHAELLDGDLDAADPRRDAVAQITRAADRAAVLTSQLLAVGRRQLLQPQSVDLNELLLELRPSLLRLVSDEVRVRIQRAPGLGRVKADPAQLEQVVLNLATNARDAMPNGGSVTFSTEDVDLVVAEGGVPAGDWVVLTVRDTGTGMDDQTRRRAFEPFYTTKELGRGTGLGLASVYGVVAQSGGHLSLDTSPGQGAMFRIFLPRLARLPQAVDRVPPRAAGTAEDPAGGAEAGALPAMADVPALPALAALPIRVVAASRPRQDPNGGPTILLVEDDRQLRALMTRILERNGFHVVAASRGDEALAIGDDELATVALLITDVVMPGADGPTVVRELSARRPGLRHLFVSGYAEATMLDQGLTVGAAFLAKPYTPDVLLARVRELLFVDEDAAA